MICLVEDPQLLVGDFEAHSSLTSGCQRINIARIMTKTLLVSKARICLNICMKTNFSVGSATLSTIDISVCTPNRA